ncbi:MAG: hypothetical protein KF708_16235 [Pirellulales bacterium]|nr:hypothetical protein [Pirellulales bacterium]
MASYLANYQKKIRILAKQEQKLRCLIQQQAEKGRLWMLSAVVKEARIRVLNAQKARFSPRDTSERTSRLANLDRQIAAVRGMTLESILAEFEGSGPTVTNGD